MRHAVLLSMGLLYNLLLLDCFLFILAKLVLLLLELQLLTIQLFILNLLELEILYRRC